MSDRAGWDARHRAAGDAPPGAPSAWVMRHALALPADTLLVDLAAGRGRHAIPLAAAGRRVLALDASAVAIAALRRAAPRAAGVVADAAALPLRDRCAGAVLCVNFLDRAVVPHVGRVLRFGGVLIVETFTTAQRALGRGPRDTAHLLEPGELPLLVRPLRILEHSEGLVRDAAGERYVARLVAVNDRSVAASHDAAPAPEWDPRAVASRHPAL